MGQPIWNGITWVEGDSKETKKEAGKTGRDKPKKKGRKKSK